MIKYKIQILLNLTTSLIIFFFTLLLFAHDTNAQNPTLAPPSFQIELNKNSLNQPIYSQCTYQADILLDTGVLESNSANIIIEYNPRLVEIVDQNNIQTGIQIGTGNSYEIFAGNNVNETTGEIRLTGFSVINKHTGKSKFGEIRFKPKQANSIVEFNINFLGENINNTLDSNIASAITSYDILKSVNNIAIPINYGVCPSLIVPTPTPTTLPTPTTPTAPPPIFTPIPTLPIEIIPPDPPKKDFNDKTLQIKIITPKYIDDLPSNLVKVVITNSDALDPYSFILYFDNIVIKLTDPNIQIKTNPDNSITVIFDANKYNIDYENLEEIKVEVVAQSINGNFASGSARIKARPKATTNPTNPTNPTPSSLTIIQTIVSNLQTGLSEGLINIKNTEEAVNDFISSTAKRFLPENVAQQITLVADTTGGVGFFGLIGVLVQLLPFILALLIPVIFRLRGKLFITDKEILILSVKTKLLKQPLPNALIEIYEQLNQTETLIKKTKTNLITGETYLYLKPSHYNLKISKLGYVKADHPITIAPNKSNHKSIFLEDDYLYNSVSAKFQFQIFKFDAPFIVSISLLILNLLNILANPELVPTLILLMSVIIFIYFLKKHLKEYKLKVARKL